MQAKEMRTKSHKDLERDLQDARTRLRELRAGVAANQWKDVREIREVRQQIARLLTVMGEKQTEEQA